MTETENNVLEINKNNYVEADFMSRKFVNAEIRNRAYINVLSAELVTDYLGDNGHQTEDIVALHSISKILEDLDIADILLPNIHIDVRAVFDENKIFIPKSHYELDITPDIYIVLKLSKNLKDATLLGYFKPSQVNKKNENKDYYFISKEKLSTPETLLKTLSKYNAEKDTQLDAREFLKGRALSVGLSDHCLNNAERKELYRLLLTDSRLRDAVAEFDNFEVLSSQVSAVLAERVEHSEQAEKAVPGIAALTTEEIFKEGVQAVIAEQTAEAAEVFDTTTEAVKEVQEIAETTAKVADIFEAAPEEEQTVQEKPEEPVKSTLEVITNEPAEEEVELTEDTVTQDEEPLVAEDELAVNEEEPVAEAEEEPVAGVEEEPVAEDETTEEEPQEEITDVEDNNEIAEEELTIGDIDDELSLDEDLEIADLDTLDTEEVEQSAQETIQDTDEVQPETEPEISEPEEISEETQEDIQDEVQEEVTDVEDNNEIAEDELVIGDIDDELSLDEDLEITDLDTLDTEDVEQSVQEDSPTEPETPVQNTPQNTVTNTFTANTPANMDISVDTLLDNAIAAIDNNPLKNGEVQEKVSESAIKLTSIAGGAFEDVISKTEKEQHERLNKIDFNNAIETYSTPATNNQISFVGELSAAKAQANLLAEEQGLRDKPTDLSELNVVQVQKQEDIVHEVVDMESIETVEREQFVEDESQIVELDKIKDVDSPTKPAPDIEELDMQQVETETMELPDLNTYTINEDGSSPLDNMNWGPEEQINPDELLDLDIAETLMGEETGNAKTDFTDDLVDGSTFSKTTVSEIEDINTEDEISISEEENPESENLEDEPIELTEDFFGKELEAVAEENTEEEKPAEMSELNPQAEISLDDNDELFGELLEDTVEEDKAEISPEEIEPENNTEVQATAETETDWSEDIGFDTLPDIEPTEDNSETTATIIEESPDTALFKATANSTVISDKTFEPGEIKIDINNEQNPTITQEENDTIGSLYDENSTVATNTILNNPGRLSQPQQQPKRGLAAGLGIAGVLVALVLVFAFGFGISKFLKGSPDETPQPISEEENSDNYIAQEQAQPASGQVVQMDNNTNALASTAGTTTTDKASFVEVKKLSWEVPGAVSSDTKFQQYFQSAGKSLKSALMTDLLSVSDKAYASEMRVSITFAQDGTFKDARIVTASGSNQIDNIVLRTVNQTLNVLKAPHSVGSYENTTAVLKIYL